MTKQADRISWFEIPVTELVQPTTDIAPCGTIALIEDLDGNVVGLHSR